MTTAVAVSSIFVGSRIVDADSNITIPDDIREKIETLKVDIDHPELKDEKENVE